MQKAGFRDHLQSPRAQLILVNSLTCGLEICLAAAITFVPPLLLEAGVKEEFMTMVLGIGPILGLLFVHIIGSASDRWNSKFGRRRPFIWLLSLGVLLSLIIIPYARHLASLTGHHHAGLEVAFLVFGIGLLDSCGQVCFTPLEALLSDLFPEGEACRKAFSVYALTVGLGACVGYLLPSVDWSGSWLARLLGQEQCLFLLLIIIFCGCVFATFFVVEEVRINSGPIDITLEHTGSWNCLRMCQFSSLPSKFWRMVLLLRSVRALGSQFRTFCYRVPITLWRLFLAQLCSWMALMTFTLFYTDFVGEGLYQGVPLAEPGTEARLRYDEGVRMGSLGLFLQSVTSIALSCFMDQLVKAFGTRSVYLAAVCCLPIAAVISCFTSNVIMVTASAAITGIPFSVLQILPYTLTSLYHHNRQVFLPKYKDVAEEEIQEKERKPGFVKETLNSNNVALFPSHSSSLCLGPSCDGSITTGEPTAPINGICLDMAILDSAFLLSQVVPSLAMGIIVQITHTVTAYVASAATFGFIAIYFSSKVVFEKSDMMKSTPL
ncbi:solute carrier family 45 member 3 [Hyperolius riggenbachi]|uniref:solute carrier family 45 member 3 n=1 Tax=Hyperolius riggenbachi TaxID=752182 RepID=UPI0035A39D85